MWYNDRMDSFHEVRAQILYTLRHKQTARFSELMRQSSLESDSFKFHVRALAEQGYIQKTSDGSYALTPTGKELANNLDNDRRHRLRQPKLSLLVVLYRDVGNGQREYLVQQRQRQPFYEYWGCISGPAQWGEDFEITAQKEIEKQTGITGITYQVHSFYRQKDYDQEKTLLEDKLFIVVTAFVARNAAITEWPHGRNEWMTLAALANQKKVFESSIEVLNLVSNNPDLAAIFTSVETTYPSKEY